MQVIQRDIKPHLVGFRVYFTETSLSKISCQNGGILNLISATTIFTENASNYHVSTVYWCSAIWPNYQNTCDSTTVWFWRNKNQQVSSLEQISQHGLWGSSDAEKCSQPSQHTTANCVRPESACELEPFVSVNIYHVTMISHMSVLCCK